ncbi:MAG: F0F1 ATP synthase subunit B [Ignavibacteriae bacterium]|nr:F0F1 ATP synthase subunit B [Ignavibacteriota bacterium]
MIYHISLLLNNFCILLLSGDGHEKPSLLAVNPGLIIWTIIIFVLLLILLKKIAWGPLIKALHSREDSIKTSIENAEKQNKDAQELLEQNKKALSEANMAAQKVINEGREMAVKLRDDIVNKANEESRKIVDQAKQEIEQQKITALQQIKEEISDLAIKAAEKILNETLDEKKQKKIVEDFINRIPKN